MAYGLEFLYLPGAWAWSISRRDHFEGIAGATGTGTADTAAVLHGALGAIDQARHDNVGELSGLEASTQAQYARSSDVTAAIAAVDGVHLEDDWQPADQAAIDRDNAIDAVHELMRAVANQEESPPGTVPPEGRPGEPPIEQLPH